jgi:hypothetical protein
VSAIDELGTSTHVDAVGSASVLAGTLSVELA